MIDERRSTITGNISLPPNKVTSWSVKILKSVENNGIGIYIGVAPSDINRNEDYNRETCGWYFYYYNSTLFSGPPHNYKYKEYGPRNGKVHYIHIGDTVGVVMDTAKGILSFALNGVNLGVAYEEIPLDKPLVPCVKLGYDGDSVELDTSEVKETEVDSSIPVPFNITIKCDDAWDSFTLSWDAVKGASFYQIEVNGSKLWEASKTNTFTKRGLLGNTEYSFRVRTVKDNTVGKWSDVVKGKTSKASFEKSGWKKCPDDVILSKKYSVDENNPRIASSTSDYNYCTIIGNTPLPLNKIISWDIKILKPKSSDGNNIFIGVAPFDIDQNEEDNYKNCGWYFNCYNSTLRSGPPHNYEHKKYGIRKRNKKFVNAGNSVRVIMDTGKNKLSFALNNVNLGVAYEGIPLDKPLVPCVILRREGFSVELGNIEVK